MMQDTTTQTQETAMTTTKQTRTGVVVTNTRTGRVELYAQIQADEALRAGLPMGCTLGETLANSYKPMRIIRKSY